MQVTLKNIRHAPSLSDETNAFTATIYIDGKKAGEASNRGCGGPTDIFPRETRERLDAYALTLPPIVTDWDDPKNPSQKFSYQPNGESIVDGLVEDSLQAKDAARIEKIFQRDLATRIIWTDASGKLRTTKKLAPEQVRLALATPDAFITKLQAEGGVVLNLLPQGEARTLWTAFVVR